MSTTRRIKKKKKQRTKYGDLGGLDRYVTHISMAAIKCTLFLSPIDDRLFVAPSGLNLGGKTLGRANAIWYPLTTICPVYLSSTGGISGFAEPFNFDEYTLSVTDAETGGGDSPKAEWNVCCERAGRFRARAALCSSGECVEEKLYGTELLSRGCTWAVAILTFSSKKFQEPTKRISPNSSLDDQNAPGNRWIVDPGVTLSSGTEI